LYYIGSIICDPNYLEHYGVKGQRKGVRNYQRYDGTLTPRGREHYRDLYYARNGQKYGHKQVADNFKDDLMTIFGNTKRSDYVEGLREKNKAKEEESSYVKKAKERSEHYQKLANDVKNAFVKDLIQKYADKKYQKYIDTVNDVRDNLFNRGIDEIENSLKDHGENIDIAKEYLTFLTYGTPGSDSRVDHEKREYSRYANDITKAVAKGASIDELNELTYRFNNLIRANIDKDDLIEEW
jgi:hypothetical protein